MTVRRVLLILGSFGLGICLMVALAKVSRISPEQVLQQIRHIRWVPFLMVIFLNFFLIFVSTEKWRTIDHALRMSSDRPQNRMTSFALTSAGLAIGTFLPVQIAMSTTRTFGTHGQGSALKRGTGGTLYEQSFDVLTMLLLAIASAATWFFHRGIVTWSLTAVAMVLTALLAAAPTLRLIRWVATFFASPAFGSATQTRTVFANFVQILQSGLLGVPMAQRLILLSCARFVVIVLMSVGTAETIGLHIPFWQMAAAIPFVAASSLIAVTPGGLGVNELTSVAALHLFGTSLMVSGQWAIANRVLITISYFFVAVCAAAVLSVKNLTESANTDGVSK